ncbi:MAG: HlyD family efflux transporter periplasmic adaptor subunit [Eubacteriales bacterium]|nr:HlyD family efflux transporter periplasmic adaptor subunit [Eubacteriales bacterium]
MKIKHAKRKKHNRNATLKVVISAVFVILILHFVFFVYSDGPKTSVARAGSIENVISTSGYVIREEYVLNSPADGTLSCLVGEGERVSKNSIVAGIYTGIEDEETQLKLNSINERLLAYGEGISSEQYKADETFSVEYQTRTTINNIVAATQKTDMERVLEEKQQLVRVLDRYKSSDEETTYASLVREKQEIESSLNAVSSQITTPVSGVFSTQIDGFESFFDTTDISKITADILDKADKISIKKNNSKAIQDKPVAKIFDNFEWYYAAQLDANQAMDLRINSTVKIRFSDISNDLLPATVCALNKTADGRTVMVISCNRYEDMIYRLRRAETEIVLGTYSGLKLPKAAIHMDEENRTGVYVLRDGVMLFKQVEVLYAGDTSIIIKESTSSSGVMLYDEVIVSGRNLQDGRRL